jgi:hypothetical protein
MRRQQPTAIGRAFGLLVAFSLVAVACGKRQVGQPCRAGEGACSSEHEGLFCLSGHFATMTCLGPSGCQKVSQGDVACDNPVASVGDGCNQEGDAACSLDKTSALVCRAAKFIVAQPCKGPRGCTSTGETVYCDNALAEPGDLCTEEADPACKSDHTSFMKCTGGKFAITNGCRGPKACIVTEKPAENKEHFECDDSMTQPGDPCEDEGEESCSLDKKSFHLCKGHKVTVSKPCPGPSGCAYSPTSSRFECDSRKK